jgi:O-antigen/teichoic acid export membrane protein
VRASRLGKRTAAARRNALGRGILTGLSTAIVGAAAAGVALLIARRIGRGAVTDGFFAAYSLYLVLVLIAATLRVVALPSFARARMAGRLDEELASYAAVVAIVGIPLVLVSTLLPDVVARAVAGDLTDVGRRETADALVWLVPSAVAQLLGAVAAAALAAFDDYGTAALAFAGGAVVGLGIAAWGIDEHGLDAVAWGIAANGAIVLAVLAAAILTRVAHAARPQGLGTRFAELARGAAIPFALQALFVIAVRFAADVEVGAVTNLSYAYLFAAFLVATTSSSIGLVSSVPLARNELNDARSATHVVSASWLSLVPAAGAAGVFALAGEPIVEAALGDAYAGSEGTEIGRLVAYLGPWIVASVALTLTFPLLFVAGRTRTLPVIALGAVATQLVLTAVARALWELPGIAVALALTTTAVLAALLTALSRRTLTLAAAGLAKAVAVTGVIAALAFGLPALVLGPVAGAAAGAVLYTVAMLVLRPRPLRQAWEYLRALR